MITESIFETSQVLQQRIIKFLKLLLSWSRRKGVNLLVYPVMQLLEDGFPDGIFDGDCGKLLGFFGLRPQGSASVELPPSRWSEIPAPL